MRFLTITATLCAIGLFACEEPTKEEPTKEEPTEARISVVIRVPQDQPTIQVGINAASLGDTVLVDTGRYVENINFNGKNITVGSLFLTTGDTSYISQTVIDGNYEGFVVTLEGAEGPTAVLSGFIITHGRWGISCRYWSSPTLLNLKIIDNSSASGNGGGIYIGDNSRPHLENLTISGNTGGSGAGLRCARESDATLVNVMISGNTSRSHGGGIFCYNSSPSLVNVTITGNTAYTGGGIWVNTNSSPSLMNAIVWDNLPQEIGLKGSTIIAYSDVKGGKDGILIEGDSYVNWQNGNLDADPLFFDPENNDFHLQEGSPCNDAGNPAPEYNNADGSRNDMGAYGGPKGGW